MIIISTNKKNLYYRVAILIALWLFALYFYRHLITDEGNSVLEVVNLIGIGLATLYYTPLVIITTLFRPIKIVITPDALIASRILLKPLRLPFQEIESFSTQSFQSANGRHERVEICYGNNKRMRIADVNVESIIPILEALRDNNIHYTGHSEKEQKPFARVRR